MTASRIAALLIAATLTATAVIAALAQWVNGKAGPYLFVTAVGAWIVFVILNSTDRVCANLRALGADITGYGDERHSAGVLDGMRNATELPPPAALRGLR